MPKFVLPKSAKAIVVRAVAAIMALIGYSACPAPLAAQTIGWWHLEELAPRTPADGTNSIFDSAMGNHGTPYGMPVYADSPNTCVGVGLSLSGDHQRVFIPDSAAYAALRGFTIEAVISTIGAGASETGFNQIVFRGDDRGSLDPFFLAMRGDGCVAFYIYNALIVQTPTPIPFNTVMAIAVTLDNATGVCNLYIDRSLVASAMTNARPDGPLDETQLPGIGIGNTQSETTAQYFAGTIYEVRLSSDALPPEMLLSSHLAVPLALPSQFACRGETASFPVNAVGIDPIDYRWQRADLFVPDYWHDLADGPLDVGGVAWGITSGAGTATLNVRPSRLAYTVAGYLRLRCIVTNPCGSVTSTHAFVTVACPADFNCDTIPDSQDFFDFLAVFFALQEGADFNQDGFSNSQDFFDFLAAFFAGC